MTTKFCPVYSTLRFIFGFLFSLPGHSLTLNYAERPASAGRKAERLFVREWSDSDSHKKTRSFAGPLDAIVRERFFFHALEVAITTDLWVEAHTPARTRWKA